MNGHFAHAMAVAGMGSVPNIGLTARRRADEFPSGPLNPPETYRKQQLTEVIGTAHGMHSYQVCCGPPSSTFATE